jgi:hypothetical protein
MDLIQLSKLQIGKASNSKAETLKSCPVKYENAISRAKES